MPRRGQRDHPLVPLRVGGKVLSAPRVVIVGAGILGTMHAVMARRAGFEVTHLDRHTEPRGATVRNFGLVWVSGRAPGDELRVALRARELWAELGGRAEVGWRPDGSMTLVTTDAELEVLQQVMARDDAADRGFRLLDPVSVRAVNPALRGSFLAGLHCTADGVVEPRRALPALRSMLDADGGYWFTGGVTVRSVAPGAVQDDAGRRYEGDVVVVCAGAEHGGPIAELLVDAPLRRCRLQMMQTEPLGERLSTSLADGDSLRYYPAFAVPALDGLPPQDEVPARLKMQLLVSQRAGGELTIGDTHQYDEPFAFDLEESAYEVLRTRLEGFLGRSLPKVVRRWAGVYSQVTDGGICHRAEPMSGVHVVTGPGGRGMTLSPAIAEETMRAVTETTGSLA
ncbi:MAG TPA: TIGR03364 family FAD-dependent oxidoreductase [Acidimicrobiales bacterium]|nr:TIGR03364 family FAD-dependent oxidoreductase [Acidimicrobiales bacterium]